MDDAKRFKLLSDILRASHFEWRRAALALAPGLNPRELVARYWTEAGRDAAKFYLGKIDPSQDVAEQTARLFVSSSVIMGEDARFLEKDSGGAWRARHKDCPWFHWHQRENLLAEDRPGCDRFIETVVGEINAALGTRLRFETTESLPEGGSACLRRFWVEH